MNEIEAKNFSLMLMETAEVAFLTTIDGTGFPQTRAMLNLRNKEKYPTLAKLFQSHEDDFLVYFTTNSSSSKVTQIQENQKASLYYCLPGEWHGLMLSGEIEIINDPSIKKMIWQNGWEMYYPNGPLDADHSILAFRPNLAKCYRKLHFGEIQFSAKR